MLAYNTEKLQERLDYLQSTGLEVESVVGMVARVPQLLSLDVKNNLQPKVHYLITQLLGHMEMLACNPTFLTLSLQSRYFAACTVCHLDFT